MDPVFAEVAIPRAAPGALTYSVPEELRSLARPGARVRVPLRNRSVPGVIIDVSDSSELEPGQIRAVEEVLDAEPLLPPHILDLARFTADYYRCPIGDTLAVMLPAPLLRRDVEEVELSAKGAATEEQMLSPKQGAIISTLREVGRCRAATLLARVAASHRGPLDALASRGLVTIRNRHRARPPRVEVTAVALPRRPLDELLAECERAPQQQRVLRFMAEREGPALVSEVCDDVGCSQSVLRALIGKGLLQRFTQLSARPPRWALGGTATRPRLTTEQETAVTAVTAAIEQRQYTTFLLEGITGSGKTEVYLRCLEATLAGDRSGLVLVPEIGLTPAAVGALQQHFGSRVAVLHSAQSEGERWREWRTIRDGEARIVVGPRSALFAPLARLGLVVVDEEHDGAYKQQEAPRYHARDLALVLASRLQIPVLLCSATPSTEATGLVERGLARKLELTQRVAGGTLPGVELVDLRQEPGEPGEQGRTLFSRRLRSAIEETVGRDEQVILLMQRRGWAPVLQCRDCGHRVQCPSCSVSMVVHRHSNDLRCHYCARRAALPDRCPECSGSLLDPLGAGTEKVAHHFQRLFPGVTTAIVDRDTSRRRGGLEGTLGAFAAGDVQVLIGTQLVAKGHHFPNVTLTGVISADALLNLPDFRAGERTFQLLTQLAGRAGRGSRPGQVLIQTYYPDHPAVRHASQHDVRSFLTEELALRRAFAYPPAARLALARFESIDQEHATTAAQAARAAVGTAVDGVRVRGPAPAPLAQIKSRWRWQLLLSGRNRELLRPMLEAIEALPLASDVHRVIDIDPLSTL
jgi:primosomal protein N' (replication factor Y)